MAFPQTTDDMQTALAAALAEAFAPLGFARVDRTPLGEAWDALLRTHALGTQFVCPFAWERDEGIGYLCDLWLEVRDERVERVIRQFAPHEGGRPSATLKFSTFVDEGDLVVDSPAALKAFVVKARRVLGDLLPRTQDMAQLDALVNGQREEVDFMEMLQSYAPFVIAWLGRNPRFDEMVLRGDRRHAPNPDNPVSPLIRIAVHLRTRVRP
jgi:hypothetical protein